MRVTKVFLLLACLVGSLSLPSLAQAEIDHVGTRADTHVAFTGVDLGLRESFIGDPGYDPYSTNDVLAQASLGFSRTTNVRGPFSFAPGVRWDFGSALGHARGADTSLVVHRLALPLEGRFHALPWLYVFGRITPGMMWQRASISDASMPEGLRTSSWVFSGEASIGTSLLFADFDGNPSSHAPKLWFTPEFGYSWAPGATSTLAANTAADDPRQFGTTDLARVAIRGAFLRFSVTTTF